MNGRTTMRTMLLMALAGLMLLAAPAQAQGQDEELEQLKQRFKQRYPTLIKLKVAQKIGEVHTGYAGAVRPAYLAEKARPDDEESPTIGQFLAAENQDRRRLYQIIAERTETTPQLVASQNAERNFAKSEPDWYLKPEGRGWILKRELDAETE